MKTLLLNDTYDWYHWGCTATSRAVRKRFIERVGPITTVPIYATRKLSPLPAGLEHFDDAALFNRFIAANKKLYDLLSAHELIVVNGEGSIHDLSNISVGLLYVAYVCKRFLGKQVRIINHSAYPVTVGNDPQALARQMYRKVYAVMDDVAVREQCSQEALQDLGIRSRLA